MEDFSKPGRSYTAEWWFRGNAHFCFIPLSVISHASETLFTFLSKENFISVCLNEMIGDLLRLPACT